MLTGTGVHLGRDGVRETARILNEYLPKARFEYHNRLVQGEMAFLEWSGFAGEMQVCDGADTFIRDGLIVAQKIHYTVHETRKS